MTTLSKDPAVPLFHKIPSRLYPFATGRDAAMLGGYLLVIIAGILLAGQWLGFTLFLLPLATGATAGMASAFQRCRPVHGVVPARARAALLAQLADAGFIATAGAEDEERFVHKAPRWLNWDANSASLRRRPDGDFDATIPAYVYFQVRRCSVPASVA